MREYSTLFKALSEEIRLRILVLLSRGELCVADLVKVLDLPQSTISRHLAYLRTAGWVIDRRQGPWVFYSLVKTNVDLQRRLMFLLEKELYDTPVAEKDLQALDRHLADPDRSLPPQQ